MRPIAQGQAALAAQPGGTSAGQNAARRRASPPSSAQPGTYDRILARAEAHRINLLQMLGRLNDALRLGRAVLPPAERVGHLTCLAGIYCDVGYTHALQGSSRCSTDPAWRSAM